MQNPGSHSSGIVVEKADRIGQIGDRVGAAFAAEAKRVRDDRRVVQLVLVVAGGALAGAAQFVTKDAGGLDWPLIGLVGVGLMAFGGFQGILRERSSAEALNEARAAVDEARTMQTEHHLVQQYADEADDKLRRMAHLHLAHLSMREAVERCFSLPAKDEAKAAATVLDVSAASIRSAIDFQMDEIWTVTVYQAQGATGTTQLVPIAADRFDDREAEKTRSWPIGVGHTGSTYAKADETVVPDLGAAELGTLDRLPTGIRHDTDSQRYRSIAAIPVRVSDDPLPWGVVVATSDRPSRFTLQHDEKGSLSAEAARALAGMVALAVASQR